MVTEYAETFLDVLLSHSKKYGTTEEQMLDAVSAWCFDKRQELREREHEEMLNKYEEEWNARAEQGDREREDECLL